MSAYNYDSLREHIGHKIECVCYGRDGKPPENVAVECVDCSTVLFDYNRPQLIVERSNSSHGRYAVRVSPVNIKYFWKRSDAEAFITSTLKGA